MSIREQFERYWNRTHVDELARATITGTKWLERSDLWGKGGYMQPVVHHDWRTFRAGYLAKRRK